MQSSTQLNQGSHMWEKYLGFPSRKAVSRKARQRPLPLRKLKILNVMPEAEV